MLYIFVLLATMCYICCIILEAINRGLIDVGNLIKIEKLKKFCVAFIFIALLVMALIVILSLIL